MDPKYLVPSLAEQCVQEDEACIRRRQEEHEREYQKAVVAITNQLRDVEGHDMIKTMKDQIRQWFIECR